MCTFSEALCERVSVREHARGLAEGHAEGHAEGRADGFLHSLSALMRAQPQLSTDQAMDILDVPQDLRNRLKEQIH